MGVWGGVCAFDEQRFRDVVIPALRAGHEHPVVTGALQRMYAHGRGMIDDGDPLGEPEPCRFEGLAAVVAQIDESFATCDLGRDFRVVGGTLTEPGRRPGEPGWGYWELVELVEWVVTGEAVRAWGHLGLRAPSPWSIFPSLLLRHDSRPEPDSEVFRVQQLLARLDTHSGYWVHGGGGFGEGISGWLNAPQTHELAPLLPRHDPDADRQSQRESFWTVVDWAVERDLGLLWGRDLELFYSDEPAAMFDEGATPADRLA